MAAQLQAASAGLDQVRRRHQLFISKREEVAVEAAMRRTSELNRRSGGKFSPLVAATPVKPLTPASPTVATMPRRAPADRTGTAAFSDDGDEESNGAQEFNPGSRNWTCSQCKAMRRFADIDAGEVPKHEVFALIRGSNRRVETKVEFYRSRAELVLPVIEARFMGSDRSGVPMLDLAKLARGSCPLQPSPSGSSLRPKTSARDSGGGERRLPQQFEQLRLQTEEAVGRLDGEHASPGELHKDASQCTLLCAQSHRLAKDTSKTTLSSAGYLSHGVPSVFSAVTVEQRALLLAERNVARELHAEAVRQQKRERHLAHRHAHRDDLERRINRKAVSEKQEVLVTWIVTVLACHSLKTVLNNFHASYAAVTALFRRRLSVQAKSTISLEDLIHADVLIDHFEKSLPLLSGIMPTRRGQVKTKMVKSLQTKFKAEVTKLREDTIYRTWFTVVRCMCFITRLKIKCRLSRRIELCKLFIRESWRGFEVRRGVRLFFQQLAFLQRGLRACVKFRDAMCRYIYMPAVWVIETETIAQLTGIVAQRVVDSEILKHRSRWEYQACLKEVKRMSDLRVTFSLAARRKTRLQFKRVTSYGIKTERTPGLPCMDHLGHCMTRRELEEGPKSFFATLDRSRLPEDQRDQLLRSLYRDGQARWFASYRRYQSSLKQFRFDAWRWRVEAAALGPAFRSSWPAPPEPVPPLQEDIMLFVDTERVRKWILASLLSSGKKE